MKAIATTCLLVAVTGLIPFLSGCDEQDEPEALETYSVEGTVAFQDGEPVAGVLVSFGSLDGVNNASAVTDDEGHYRIKAGQGEGLPAGDYRVVVGPAPGKNGIRPIPIVDPKYSTKETSGLTTTIKPPDNFYDIEVERIASHDETE